MRREKVMELLSTGLKQEEIAQQLMCSQPIISNDIIYLKRGTVEFVRKISENTVFEYKQVMTNFYQLRKEAWGHFHSTESESVKTNLYGIIESINVNIMDLLAAGDMIELESVLKNSKEQTASIKEGMNNTIDSSSSTQAIF